MARDVKGVKGWLGIKRRNFEKFLFLLHRISGIIVGLYFILHVIETGNIINGKIAWESLMGMLYNPFTHTGLLIIAFLSVFHALNGVRLLLAEQGFGIGRAKRQGYPIVPISLTSFQRKLAWIMLISTVIFSIYAFYELFIVSFMG